MARSAYDGISGWYDLMAGPFEQPLVRRAVGILDPKPGESVLEIGCGTGGALAMLAARVGGTGLATGIDLSRGMRRVARRRMTKTGIAGCVRLVAADGRMLPFADRNFDAVFMSFTLELFDDADIGRVLAGCRRVLRPGGRLTVVSMAVTGNPGVIYRLYEWAHRTWPRHIDCRPIDVQRAMEKSGFRILRGERFMLAGLPVDIACGG